MKDVAKEAMKPDCCYVIVATLVIIHIVWIHLLIMYLTEDGNVNGMLACIVDNRLWKLNERVQYK